MRVSNVRYPQTNRSSTANPLQPATASANLPKTSRYPPLTQKSKEDELISSLQKQVYYLELEMKLMKDKELDTKNKVGGYEVLFRDGVPLNENFLALKTKYKNERDDFEKRILNLQNTIINTENENNNLRLQLENTNKSYFDLIQKLNISQEDYANRIFDANQKVFNEDNTMVTLGAEKNKVTKDLNNYTASNIQHNRTIEKNSLFKEDPNERNFKIQKLAEEKFADVDHRTEQSLLELDSLEKKQFGNLFIKNLENENFTLLQLITKLEQNSHMLQAKIAELQNSQIINKKYLLDEVKIRDVHLKENNRLNEELDSLSKLSEEKLRERVKECEDRQMLILKNQMSTSDIKMGLLLDIYKKAEETARNLLEEKNGLLNKIAEGTEASNKNNDNDTNIRNTIISTKNNINQLTGILEDNENELNELINENNRFRDENDALEKQVKDLKIKIDELQQKIELNAMLKDVDINELKMITNNNAIVNRNINTLISKWDKVHSKLEEIEKKAQEES